MYWQDKVWEEVERFRLDHIDSEWASIPLDIFSIVDVNLGLDIIPFDDLRNRYNIEAALTKDYSGIYIDAETHSRQLKHCMPTAIRESRFRDSIKTCRR